MTTGELIRKARMKAGLTQKELADALGISYVGVSQWENNVRNPKFETLKRIAYALKVPLSSLLPMDELILSARRTDKKKNEVEIAAERAVEAKRAEMLEYYDNLKFEWQCDATAYIKGLCADSSHIREYYADEIWPDKKDNKV